MSATFTPTVKPERPPATPGSSAVEPRALAEGFFDETAEILDALEQRLLSLNTAQADDEALHAIFRCAHSLKGGAATFGFADVAVLTHQMETLLDKLRRHELAPTPGMVDVLLLAGDALRAQLARHRDTAAAPVDPRALLASIGALANTQVPGPEQQPAPASEPRPAPASVPASTPASASASASASAAPVRALELTLGPLRDPAVADALAGLFDDIPGLGSIEPLDARRRQDDGMRRFKLLTAASDDELISLFGFHLPPQQVRLTPFVPTGHDGPATPEASSLRVPVTKVDTLVQLVADLAATQSALAALAALGTASEGASTAHPHNAAGSAAWRQRLADLARNTHDLQQAVMGMRMTPVAVVFNRFPRLLHDLAGRLGKQIELVQAGGSIELDKDLVEKIADPLTHLVRNSCDHGIELPAERLAQGKPAHGTLRLSARRQGAGIVIELRDDGRGLSRSRLIAKAHERGIAAHAGMPDAEVWAFIFAPGFTTAQQVTDVSGRGVGMDVVQRSIAALGGTVKIDSTEGQGMAVRVHLPLTHRIG